MNGVELHNDAVVFDGLIVSNWSREVFEDMRRGGLTAANCTCSVWEGFHDTMVNIGQWNRWFQDHGDLILKARTTADIRAAKEQGKTAVVLGFQNTSAFEDRLDFIEKDTLRRDLPPFRVGDQVRVHVKVKEGDKERVQVFEGLCLRRRGSSVGETFNVRKISNGVGVERIFPVQSPLVTKLEIVSRGFVRRARC